METWNLGYASTNDGEWFEPLELLGVPASSIPFYSPGDFCETSLRLHSIRKLLSHPRDKASQFQRLPPRLTLPPPLLPPSGAFATIHLLVFLLHILHRHYHLSLLLFREGPSLTRYITEPQNIDPGNCWLPMCSPLVRGVTPLVEKTGLLLEALGRESRRSSLGIGRRK